MDNPARRTSTLRLIIAGCDKDSTDLPDHAIGKTSWQSPISRHDLELLRIKFGLPRATSMIVPQGRAPHQETHFHHFNFHTSEANDDRIGIAMMLPGSTLVGVCASLFMSYSPSTKRTNALLLCHQWTQANYISDIIIGLASLMTHPAAIPAILCNNFQESLLKRMTRTWHAVFDVELGSGQSGIKIVSPHEKILPSGKCDDPGLSRRAISAAQLAIAWDSYAPQSRTLIHSVLGFLDKLDAEGESKSGLYSKQSGILREYLELRSLRAETINNHLAHTSNEINRSLAESSQSIAIQTQRDSSAMKAIAVLTMTFLPATYIASLFATPGINSANPSQKIYWAVTIPLTAFVLGIWAVWTHLTARNLQHIPQKLSTSSITTDPGAETMMLFEDAPQVYSTASGRGEQQGVGPTAVPLYGQNSTSRRRGRSASLPPVQDSSLTHFNLNSITEAKTNHPPSAPRVTMSSQHDFIIIGGGTSGLVVAARLTEDPNTSVLVIEAGSEHTNDPRIRTPALWLSLLGSPDFDWNYKTIPQVGLNGKIIPLSQGKLLGGSSAINGLAFVANSKAAVDAWAGFGNPGWDWETLGPYYKKFHTLVPASSKASDHLRLYYVDETLHAKDGPIQASFPEESTDPLPSAWVDTISALGFPATGDPFTGKFSGGYINPLTVDANTRTRSDAATAYFTPAKSRPNLHIITGALAEKIIFDTSNPIPKAIGVQIQQAGITSILPVKKEIILAAGPFGSPKLLELSGIGNQDLLKKFNIPLLINNPNVGENLQDHPVSTISFQVNEGVKTIDALARQDPEAVTSAMHEYDTNQSGPFAVGNYTGALLPVPDFVEPKNGKAILQEVLTKNTTSKSDDSAPHHTSFVHSVLADPTEGVGNMFMYAACANVSSPTVGADIIVKDETPANFISICAALCFPLSRGSAHITSSNPSDESEIDPRYLTHPLDLEVQARLLRYAETIASTEPLSKYIEKNGRRNPGAPASLDDLEVTKQYAKISALSCWHLTSTCAMLPRDRGGVVDSQLHVHGVQGLRIVDSSIIPLATRGNTQTTVYAVAERAADLIKQDFGIVSRN
ncbi:hypothetical protein QBC38DRAFT_447737 [Podospora fimiseda]|uniref:Glucose-methanol-choline oxidoreductase N-terminal domain-containing protein n=1 Tax=Podospora fimiseda TaxID=252190 RepID=A0AAN6YU63_9PEZI|nr:hypothetical protein QBC38DRAFT_447737 [Podospora fimiseda]